ncbi:MAG: ABC transporter ATP-binding protein [Conexibacteraceae bacterium]|nr:ABC transporter ATP-binding protein [Conexibacteraceae bacterium]
MSVAEPASQPGTGESPVVAVRDLRIELTSSHQDIVDEIGIEIVAGEVLGLVGESGSGKTTVGMSLLGYCRPGGSVSGGAIVIDGKDLSKLRESEVRQLRGGVVSYIPQDPGTALNPALRLRTQLSEQLAAHRAAMSVQERDERMREALGEVLLPSDDAFLNRYPHQLSGGQQQRVAIAMAFACRPRLIVCDEPTTGLDVTTQAKVLETVRDLCRVHNVAALYVSHDLAVVAELADKVAVMYAGRIVERATRDELFGAPRHPYTRSLLKAVPDITGGRVVMGIPGRAPLPSARPEGCFFAPRCAYARDDCRQAFPPITSLGDDHIVRCYHVAEAAADSGGAQAPTASARDRGPEVLTVRGLNAAYNRRATVFDIDLEVHRDECLALIGESGSGKTTLARCIAGLHHEFTGEIRLGDTVLATKARKRTQEARKEIQYVFQNPYASLNPRRTVGQTLARQLQLFAPASRRETATRVGEFLERVSLSADAANRFPDQLSGGERQRVAIARALAAGPSLLVCDEVTSALDVSVQAAIVDLLADLRAEMGLSLLFITHNLALIRTIADRMIVMTEGRIVESGEIAEVFAEPKAEYTRQLLSNTPSIEAALAQPDGSHDGASV